MNRKVPITESQHQRALVQWWKLACRTFGVPEKCLLHIPNEGKRSEIMGNMMRKEGLRRGVPDLFLAYPVGKYSGLWIEMKTEKGRVTPEQTDYLLLLAQCGYVAEVCHGWEKAKQCIERYLAAE